MTFSEYQKESRATAIYPPCGKAYVYPVLGLASEAGEVVQVVKKIIRDQNGEVDDGGKRKLSGELGDVLWYVAQVATEFDLNLDEIASANMTKLNSRMARGVIGGSGDNR
ncbi:hypothetical protein COV04_01905 [Candidatus Uhrbacteria bacterium CG10_big_fil_rev_8_21_14_0_10_48_11]|uniref:NTP pyrophosphohydrolase MazG-like domain-containing protein n=1 Tax=Candidatus Uhrbacteria bacterium CG10_big_fil_rev_8_21_14_0_10_48_11 TaxID=1975037 RepID=A0A2M8LEV5_9BACT|nr:MAG: hypothetical protein COV04_01905 [Candidatus Uhrbacteria bacterium CG10_big_fil_rev_8_21_14_0_10_48_11]